MSDELPKGWAKTTLGEIAEPTRERAFPTEFATLPYVGLEHIESQTMRLLGHGYAREIRSSSMRFLKGDVLYGKMRPYLNKVWVADFDGLCSAEFLVFRKRNGLNSQFLAARLNADDFVTFANRQVSGERPRVDFKKLSLFPILLPPIAEQNRIVVKLNAALSAIQRAETATNRASRRLDNYCNAVLNAAISGELTHKWRKQKSDIKPADQLHDGGVPSRSALPLSWSWLLSANAFSFVTSGSRGWSRYYSDRGALFIRVGNLNHNSIDLDLRSIQRVLPPESAEGRRTKIAEGDILISITADVGMIALIKAGLGEAYINQHIALARPVGNIDTQYLAYFLAAKSGGQEQFLYLQRGATKVGLGLDDIRNIWIACPPLTEQHEIVREIDRRLSAANRLAESLDQQLGRASATRRLLLQEAFAGRLVSQDSNDEPASVLLKLIRANREAEAQNPKEKHMTKFKSKDARRPLLDVLREHKEPMTPEQLFLKAGFEPSQVDLFYRELSSIRDKLEERKPKASDAMSWPYHAKVTLQLKES